MHGIELSFSREEYAQRLATVSQEILDGSWLNKVSMPCAVIL